MIKEKKRAKEEARKTKKMRKKGQLVQEMKGKEFHIRIRDSM